VCADQLEPFVLAIAGPTGVGKSRLAMLTAQRLAGEIVNYDSVQVYRGFDVGSAKATPEDRAAVAHHLLDIVEADQEFNAADYQKAADAVISSISRRGHLPILVGGTGFYLRAVTAGLPELPGRDPALRARLSRLWEHPRSRERLSKLLAHVDPITHARLAPADRHRRERALEVWFAARRPISSWDRPSAQTPVRVPHLLVALHLPREVLIQRLDQRVMEMYDGGLIEETAALLSRYPPAARPFAAIGYAEAVRFLNKEISRVEAISETQRRTRAYAKRQMTWLRGEREALWISAEAEPNAIVEMVAEKVHRRTRPS
jgi:tRNA dimethylallyltransferase